MSTDLPHCPREKRTVPKLQRRDFSVPRGLSGAVKAMKMADSGACCSKKY
ncbi:MAG: hypothetical protein R2941_18255 [Desulfobacterales bacterium]